MTGMVPKDVYELTGVGSPRLSPDGRTVAYELSTIDGPANEYRGSIWLVPADGSAEPRQFTSGSTRDASPVWSPDGSRIAFTSKRASKAMQLFVIPIEGGEAVQLTELSEDVEELDWSPDGTKIVFSARVRDLEAQEEERNRPPQRLTRLQFRLDDVGWTAGRRQHLFTVPADGSADPTQLTFGDFEDSAPAWSPDGDRIAFTSARHENWDIEPTTGLYVVAASGGDPEALTSPKTSAWAPSWSPDGARLAHHYSSEVFDEPRHSQIAVLDVATREQRLLTTSLDRQCVPFPQLREPLWRDDELLFCIEEQGNWHLYTVASDGSREPNLLRGGTLGITGYDRVGTTTVYSSSEPATLSELFNDGKRLTNVGRNFVAERELVSPERFVATSKDGTEVEAWIMRPAGFEEGKKYPVLLNIHGGPFAQYGNRFFDEFQVYTGAGYVVVYSNPRGSSGYSEAWARAIRGPSEGGPGMGSVDHQDLEAVLDTALDRYGFCDPDRLGVIGGSYGGYMTSWMIAHSDRFKAACSERAVNAWYSMHGSSDWGWAFKGMIGSFQFEDPEAWLKISPLSYATNITTPLLILHSESDLRCDIEQGEQLFTTLRLLQRDVEFVRFPGESHELSRSGSPLHRVQRFEILLEFFDKHLKT
ncbi:MAG: prolyl oligopeptidase family serine peptidase [Actinobacteria bacterium]|nr:prolyl oligopeptidase family serine peptidase [Actinomycetota bacterium]